MGKYLLLFVFAINYFSVFAQRKQISEEYEKNATLPYTNMPGKLSYGYIVSEDGINLKDGLYSVKCSISGKQITVFPHVYTYNGSYVLNANFVKGNLNGTVSGTYKLNTTKKSRTSTENFVHSSTFSGNFLDGVPNGNFKVDSKTDTQLSLVANYNKGMLVGAYSCNVYDDDWRIIKYRGTLSSTGKFIGAWNFNGDNAQFQNGIMISRSNAKISTKPALVALAKQYAAKTITKEKLMEQGVMVRQDSVKLGDYARMAILNNEGVNWDELKGYDLTQPNVIKYEYLEEAALFTEQGLEKLIKGIVDEIVFRKGADFMIFSWEKWDLTRTKKKYGCIEMDKNMNLPFIEMHRNHKNDYYKGGILSGRYYDKVYITDEQMERIDKTMRKTIVENALKISDLVEGNVKDWFLDNQLLDGISNPKTIESGLDEISDLEREISKAVPYLKEEGILYLERLGMNHGCFIAQSTIDSIAAFKKTLMQKIKEKQLDLLCTYLVENGTAYNISSQNDVKAYFVVSDMSVLKEKLKEFCPIVACKIVEMKGNNEVIMNITKRISKKKGNITYQVTLKMKGNRILVNSIDFAKASVVE